MKIILLQTFICKIEAAAQLGNVSPAYLMGWDITSNIQESQPIFNLDLN